MEGPPGTLYHFPSPTEVARPPTHGGLHPPQGDLCGGTEVAQGLSGPTMLVASPGGKAHKGVPHPIAHRDAADPSRDDPSSWLEFPRACHRQRCRQAGCQNATASAMPGATLHARGQHCAGGYWHLHPAEGCRDGLPKTKEFLEVGKNL